MIENKKIYVVMPAYNESAHIAETIKLVPSFVDKIVVVDDNSSDGTDEQAKGAGDNRVVVLRNEKNLGVGGATKEGYKFALEEKADIVVKLDSDGQMDPGNIKKLIKPIVDGRADYAKGFRFHNRATLRKMPKVRLIGNLGLSYLVKLASGYWDTFDPVNGFTAIDRSALELLELDRISNCYYFETDMLCHLNNVRAVVKDVMLATHYGDEVSMLNPAKILFKFPPKLMVSFIRRIIWRYYISDFSTFSILFLFGWVLFLFGLIYGFSVWTTNAAAGVATPTGTVMVSVVPLFLGFQMLLHANLYDINNVPDAPLQNDEDDAEQDS